MVQFFAESSFDPPLSRAGERAMLERLSVCLRVGNIERRECWLARDGRHMLCRFEAQDASALRNASRCADIELDALWAGTIYTPAPSERSVRAAGVRLAHVIGERTFAAPITLADLVSIERSCTWCLETHQVQLARLFLAFDGKRAVALLRAPDAESVRLAYRHAGLLFDHVRACRRAGT